MLKQQRHKIVLLAGFDLPLREEFLCFGVTNRVAFHNAWFDRARFDLTLFSEHVNTPVPLILQDKIQNFGLNGRQIRDCRGLFCSSLLGQHSQGRETKWQARQEKAGDHSFPHENHHCIGLYQRDYFEAVDRHLMVDKHSRSASARMMLLSLSNFPWRDSCVLGGKISLHWMAT